MQATPEMKRDAEIIHRHRQELMHVLDIAAHHAAERARDLRTLKDNPGAHIEGEGALFTPEGLEAMAAVADDQAARYAAIFAQLTPAD